MNNTKMRKPLWVHVLWSENALIKDDSLMTFKDFEAIAWEVSHNIELINGGYDKTN